MTTMRWVLMVVLCSCGGMTVADFQAAANAAKTCDPAVDSCRNAGASPCLCATPVNATRAREIDDLAKQVACGGATVQCAPMLNPRCVNGTCVGSIQ